MKHALFLIIFCFILASSSVAQDRKAEPGGMTFFQSELALGLNPELSFLSHYPSLGLSLSLGKYVTGEGAFKGFGLSAGGHYIPQLKTFTPEIALWNHATAFVFGYYVGGAFRLYAMEKSDLAFLPKLGLSFYRIHLYYSYSLFLKRNSRNFFKDTSPYMPRHNLTLSYHFKLLSIR